MPNEREELHTEEFGKRRLFNAREKTMRTLICLIVIAFLGGLSQLASSQESDPEWTADDLWKYSKLGDVLAAQDKYVVDVVAVVFGCDRRQLRGLGFEISADQSR